MESGEKIIFNFSIIKPRKYITYQIKIKIEDKSSEKYNDFETELVKCQDDCEELNFKFTAEIIFYFDKKQKIKIYFINIDQNNNKNKYEKKTTLASLVSYPNSIYEKALNSESSERVCIVLTKKNKNSKYSIFDYLKSGIRILGFISLDFSEGKNKEPISESNNNYKNIIFQILNRVAPYNKKDSFFLYGYGAKLKNSKNSEVLYKSIFNLNTKEEDAPINIEKIIPEFEKCLNNITREKKVYFSSLIRRTLKKIYKLYKLTYYNVLFIIVRELTDEEDIQNTIDVLIESSYLPLTIIFICEGINDFQKINNLFDSKIKFSSSGMQKIRNNILSYSYSKDFDKNAGRMVEHCLRDISQHILEYYKLNKCTPVHIKINDIKNIEKSIINYKNSIWLYESKMSLIGQKDDESKNFNKIHHESKNISNDKKKETPREQVFEIPKTKSIMQNLSNPFNNNIKLKEDNINNNKHNLINNNNINKNKNEEEKKYTPGSPSIIVCNGEPINNKYNENSKYMQNPYNNLSNENQFRITAGNSIAQGINENPYQKDEKRQYKITPTESVNTIIKSNPYQNNKNKVTPHHHHAPDQYFIPTQSITQDNKPLINPYNKNNQNIEINNNYSRENENNKININNMNNNKNKASHLQFPNYSIDSNN